VTLRTFLAAQALFNPDPLFPGVLANSESNHLNHTKRAKWHGIWEKMNASLCPKFEFEVNKVFMPLAETAWQRMLKRADGCEIKLAWAVIEP